MRKNIGGIDLPTNRFTYMIISLVTILVLLCGVTTEENEFEWFFPTAELRKDFSRSQFLGWKMGNSGGVASITKKRKMTSVPSNTVTGEAPNSPEDAINNKGCKCFSGSKNILVDQMIPQPWKTIVVANSTLHYIPLEAMVTAKPALYPLVPPDPFYLEPLQLNTRSEELFKSKGGNQSMLQKRLQLETDQWKPFQKQLALPINIPSGSDHHPPAHSRSYGNLLPPFQPNGKILHPFPKFEKLKAIRNHYEFLMIREKLLPKETTVIQTLLEVKRADKNVRSFLSGLLKKGGDKSKKPKQPKQESTVKCVSIFRYDPDECEPPYLQQYEVDVKESGKLILDILLYIKNEIDPTLSFRRSCREGICGSCGMNINGKNHLACIKTAPPGDLIIYPLPHLYVVRDLICDFSNFYRQYKEVQPWLQRCDEKEFCPGTRPLKQSIRDRGKVDGMYECVLCACCSTSCPAYWWHGNQDDRFLGPAALLHAYRWIIDSRDEKHCERLDRLKSKWNLYRCHTIFNCTTACPKKLNPGMMISKLKLLCAGRTVKEPSDMEQDNELFDADEAAEKTAAEGPPQKKKKK